VGLPLWMTYGTGHAAVFGTLLGCYGIAGAYKLFGGQEAAWARQLIFDRAAAGSLRQLQELILDCADAETLGAIQVQILTLIEDKTKQVLLETDEGVISANLMIADENTRTLRLIHFSRHSKDRKVITVQFGQVGAGKAIENRKTVYIRDTKTPDLADVFRTDAPYRSILSIPITCEHLRIGVVNVDSTRPSAFETKSLEDHLAPYVQLIGLSMCIGGAAHASSK
jgi:hypothetical protein